MHPTAPRKPKFVPFSPKSDTGEHHPNVTLVPPPSSPYSGDIWAILGAFGPFWDHSRAVEGLFWGCFVGVLRCLGFFWSRLGLFWGLPGFIWGQLGINLKAVWDILGLFWDGLGLFWVYLGQFKVNSGLFGGCLWEFRAICGRFGVIWGQFGAISVRFGSFGGSSRLIGGSLGLFGAGRGGVGHIAVYFWQFGGSLGPALGYLEAGRSGSAVLRCGGVASAYFGAACGEFGAFWGHFRAARHKMAAAPRDGGHLGAAEQNGGGEELRAWFLR